MEYKKAKLYDADGNLAARWKVYYYYKDPETGKYLRQHIYISQSFKTRSQRYGRARELIRQINYKLSSGFNPFMQKERSQTSIAFCLKHYLDAKSISIRGRTYTSYASYINDFKEWCDKYGYSKMQIDDFNYNHAGLFMEVVGRRKISKRTYNNILQGVKTCFNWLVQKEYIMVNPFFKQKKIRLEDTEIIAFTKAELDIITNSLPSHNYDLYVIALLIFNCFMRPAEIVRLKVRHLKSIRRILVINGEVSKNKKTETVAMPVTVKDAIGKLDLGYPDEYYVFGRNLKRNPKQVAPTRIAEAWKVYASKVSLSKNIYALKHTGNGLALENGANARDLQLQNRHSSLDQTQKYLDRFSRRPSDSFLDNLPSL